jgi:hypothetical protein
MNTSLSSHALQVKCVGQTIQYRTLSDLLKALTTQPVLVMPLERTITRDRLLVSQWIIHVTTRDCPTSPISFVSLWAAEVMQRAIGPSLMMPTQHERLRDPITRARHFQEQFYVCIVGLLTQCSHVSQILPARYCLPEEWVWSSLGAEPRIQFRDEAWTLIECS